MRTAFGVVAALVMLGTIPAAAHAQWRVGGWVGGEHESSWDEFLVVGGDARGAVGSQGIELNPRFAYYLRSHTTRFQLELNAIKPLVLANKSWIEPFVGIGAVFESVSYDNSDLGSQTHYGYNYIVGGTIPTTGRVQPFGQFEYSVIHDDGNAAVISVGLHVQLGSRPAPKPAPPVRAPARR